MLKSEVIKILRREFRLDWGGVHGAPHWARVRYSGLRMAKVNGARSDVVECFALLHDSQRMNDYTDPQHGARAADYVVKINGALLHLDVAGLDLLVEACAYHSDGRIEADITVQTCWDADRLDLGRVGKKPDPLRLCTPQAKEPVFREAAYRRSLRGRYRRR